MSPQGIPRDYEGESRTVSYTVVAKIQGRVIDGKGATKALAEYVEAIERLNIQVGECGCLTESMTEI